MVNTKRPKLPQNISHSAFNNLSFKEPYDTYSTILGYIVQRQSCELYVMRLCIIFYFLQAVFILIIKKPYFGCAARKIIGPNYIENQAKYVNLFEIYRRK